MATPMSSFTDGNLKPASLVCRSFNYDPVLSFTDMMGGGVLVKIVTPEATISAVITATELAAASTLIRPPTPRQLDRLADLCITPRRDH